MSEVILLLILKKNKNVLKDVNFLFDYNNLLK